MATPQRKRGRPSSYTPQLADKVLQALPFADGGLEEVCAAPGMPGARTVYRWLEENEDFRQKYAHAREVGGDVQAQRGLRDALHAKDAQLGRLRFDARKWTASKLAPKKYGDRVSTEVSGPGGGPIETIDRAALAKLSDDDIERAIAISNKLAAATGASGGEGA